MGRLSVCVNGPATATLAISFDISKVMTSRQWLLGMFLILGIEVCYPSSAEMVAVSIELTQAASKVCPANGQIVASPVGTESEPTHTWEFVGSSEYRIDLDVSIPWDVSIRAPGCWAPTKRVNATSSPEKLLFSLAPAAYLTGRVSSPETMDLLSSLSVELRSVPRSSPIEIPANRVDCDLANGSFTCELPAAVLDLRLEVGDFAPAYHWNVKLEPGQTLALESWDLARGASLAGWVSASGAHDLEDISLELRPEIRGPIRDSSEGERRRIQTRETTANHRGFFQFTGLEAGHYVLAARKEPGYSPIKIPSIEVVESVEVLLDETILLERRVELTLQVDPPLDPDENPWEVRLDRIPLSLGASLEPVRSGPIQMDGSWSSRDVEHGLHQLSVLSGDGSAWYRERVQIHPDMEPLTIEIRSFEVEGRISVGDAPIEATLEFRRPDPIRVRFVTDDNGRFEGLLPHEGRWSVVLRPKGRERHRSGQRILGSVEVRRSSTSRVARIEIELPATLLRGRVIDSDGQPVHPSQINVTDPRGSLLIQEYGEKDGSFEIRGLDPEEVLVQAIGSGGRESGFQSYQLEEDREGPFLELVVGVPATLSGQVFSDRGPVSGALIREYDGTFFAETTSSLSGRYNFNLSGSPRGVHLFVIAAGFSGLLLHVPIEPGKNLQRDIWLDPVGGTVEVDLRSGSSWLGNSATLLPLQFFFEPSGNGNPSGWNSEQATFTINLGPGEYVNCPGPSITKDCVSGTLQPGSFLRLSLTSREAKPEEGLGGESFEGSSRGRT